MPSEGEALFFFSALTSLSFLSPPPPCFFPLSITYMLRLMFFFVFFTFDYSWTFGESFGCLENMGRKVPFAEALNELLEISSGRLVDPIWRLRESISPVGTNVRQNKAVMRQHIHRIIAKHREQDWSDPNKKSNLLMMYMEAKGVDGQPYSDELLVDTMMTLLVRKQTS